MQTPPVEDISFVDYRTVDSIELKNPSRNLIDTMHDMEQIQEWMRDHLIFDGAVPLQFVGAKKFEWPPIVFAQHLRELLNIKTDWYKEPHTAEESFNLIRSAISNAGVIVMMSGIVGNNTHRSLDINEFRAFAIVDEYAPLILKKEETLCNAVAAEILVPQSSFVATWNSSIVKSDAEQTIKTLANDFKCGVTVIARRAYDSNFIEYDLYQKIAQLAVHIYNENRRLKKERGESGGDYYRTAASRIDQRFFSMLINSVRAGRTLYSDAFRLTNTNRSTFTNLADSVGGGIG